MVDNPFEITKAVDFTDDEIFSNFVNYPDGGFESIAAPTSPMPKFLVGGKGGGRTHLMRFYSYSLRSSLGVPRLNQIQEDGYIGIYFRCSGLNASRFAAKRISDEIWDPVFNYYMDLWLTENLLDVLSDLESAEGTGWGLSDATRLARVVDSRMDGLIYGSVEQDSVTDLQLSVAQVRDAVAVHRREIDRSINNASILGRLDVRILSNPGELVFATAAGAEENLPGLKGLVFNFLIDEFENLSEIQQRYVNTLVREKTLPTSFLIGSRSWGVKTHRTLSAEEENKKGSEFEWVELEDRYRSTGRSYSDFCISLSLRRLQSARILAIEKREDLYAVLPSVGIVDGDRLGDISAFAVLGDLASRERRHMIRLLENVTRQIDSSKDVELVFSALANEESPMSEKLGIHRFYQLWASTGTCSPDVAKRAAREIATLHDGTATVATVNFLNLWKHDLLAQIYRENERWYPYLGLDRFIEMSGFLPRSFLMIMKYVTQAAMIRSKPPFESTSPIASEVQVSGVLEASRWFIRDSRPTDEIGAECEQAIRRLATLFNRLRYSDKPTEVSCVAFSSDMNGLSINVRRVIDACVAHNLLLEVEGGRVGRNQGSTWRKFQLHPMICPSFALPTARRGELQLSGAEMLGIFDSKLSDAQYASAVRPRLRGMEAPFKTTAARSIEQEGLF